MKPQWMHRTLLLPLLIGCLAMPWARGQESDDSAPAKLILETRNAPAKPKPLYTAKVSSSSAFDSSGGRHKAMVEITSVRGKAELVSLEIRGDGEVTEVGGDAVQAWSVRREEGKRYLEVSFKEPTETANFSVKSQSKNSLPATVGLFHLSSGRAIGFSNTVDLTFSGSVSGNLARVDGFTSSDTEAERVTLQTVSGGDVEVSLRASSGTRPDIELTNAILDGNLHRSGKSADFNYQAQVIVSRPGEIDCLSGDVTLKKLPSGNDFRLVLNTTSGAPKYKLIFDKPGTYDIDIDFVSKVEVANGWSTVAFRIATGAIVPLKLQGLPAGISFQRSKTHIVPLFEDDVWKGFLPASGDTRLSWKEDRKAGEGKLFFTTTARTEASVSAGLLKQNHTIEYAILQGELKQVDIEVRGPGEILNVQGQGIVSWSASSDEDEEDAEQTTRKLSIQFSQPMTQAFALVVSTQSAIGTFPASVKTVTLHPEDAIRHSGYIRISNQGAVRIEPTDLQGVTQLSPQQYPGQQIKARQIFVYRFPSSDHSFTIAADQIQPEVGVSQVVLYQLAETERTIAADIELDIREAPIREFTLLVPEEYSVVSVAGASVADYLVASESTDGSRSLKVIFSGDVSGRQLISIALENGIAAEAASWVLPRLTYPSAKNVAGNIGVVGAPGFRVQALDTELLVEKPLSYFPKPVKNLQQAFRIRESQWSATMQIEVLERSIQADVFHLYSLSQGAVYGSSLINYFITGAPVAELTISVPETLGNVVLDGQDVRTWRRDGENLIVSLHQPVMGPYTLLVTFEQEAAGELGVIQAAQVTPIDVASEQGFIQVVSPMQVDVETLAATDDLLVLDPLELPAEFRLLSTAPSLGTWQYTDRPFRLDLKVDWFEPGTLVGQIVEFSEAKSRVSADGELVTDVVYYVKSRGQRTLRMQLPDAPVKLWAASVNGEPVTARQAGPDTLIPLPGVDPNVPVEVSLRLGKPAVSTSSAELTLPKLAVPVLKTQWDVEGDQQNALLPLQSTVDPPKPVVPPSGLTWLSKTRGIAILAALAALLLLGYALTGGTGLLGRTLKVSCWIAASAVAFSAADLAVDDRQSPAPLRLDVPVLAAGETIQMKVKNVPQWQLGISFPGVVAAIVGAVLLVLSCLPKFAPQRSPLRFFGVLALAAGLLLQSGGAGYFFYALGVALLVVLVIPSVIHLARLVLAEISQARREAVEKSATVDDPDKESGSGGVATTAILFIASTLSLFGSSLAVAQEKSNEPKDAQPKIYAAADSLVQQWQVASSDGRLAVVGRLQVSGQPGDQFVLLYAPAVLTKFDGKGLRVSKVKVAGRDAYIVTIPRDLTLSEETPESSADELSEDSESGESEPGDDQLDESAESPGVAVYSASFEYQLESVNVASIPVLTGTAAVQKLTVQLDQSDWELSSAAAIRVDSLNSPKENGVTEKDDTSDTSRWEVLLSSSGGSLEFRPKQRDVASEETKFFVEGNNLYVPGPGVVDGYHRLSIRPSQGEVRELEIDVPNGLTVSSVDGPIASWQFDADNGKLKLQLEPAPSVAFNVLVQTQRGLSTLPAEVELAPLTVTESGGEVGVLALAFGNDAQPEKATTDTLSNVSLTDFDSRMLPESKPTLFRVYRYGKSGGSLTLRVAPVAPEVRVASKQVLSFGDERVLLAVNFAAEITRAGLFQLSFPLPEGLEVESLSGDALDHWSELEENGQRIIVMHLGGKTIGSQQFALTLSGLAPSADDSESSSWQIPRFEIREAKRQTGELAVRPTTGIRLRTLNRQNASEMDPREMGGSRAGALAFRLLQKDWTVQLGIEQLQPWITGTVLHDITIREGQTRSRVVGDFVVQNASIRSMQIRLPFTDEQQAKTLRATGETISDLVRLNDNSDIWELRFKRRIVGRFRFQIEYERRGEREDETEALMPLELLDARQVAYYFAVRAGGRLELKHDGLSQGWQEADWNSVPQVLREAGKRSSPALSIRAVSPPNPLRVTATRHSLADSLKLRVASGQLTTVLSPTGDQITAVDVSMEVVQRSSLSVTLPDGGELFSIFVNGESVHSIRDASAGDAWQFYILPGIDDRTATVRFVYTVQGGDLSNVNLTGPLLNVPLENIRWSVITPQGFELVGDDGNLELISQQHHWDTEASSREFYLSKISGKRREQKQQAAELLEQANTLLQQGQQTKARRALNSVANQYALDAASNEDARVQLENLQTQQAIVGLNTRRQRLFLYNNLADVGQVENDQLMQAAAGNPILQQEQLNFRPQQLSQLLRGNTSEDNAVLQRIAGRLVQHQRSSEPAPQAIIISLPEEGKKYEFSRTVQVSETAPLKLELQVASEHHLPNWRAAVVGALLLVLAAGFAFQRRIVSE